MPGKQLPAAHQQGSGLGRKEVCLCFYRRQTDSRCHVQVPWSCPQNSGAEGRDGYIMSTKPSHMGWPNRSLKRVLHSRGTAHRRRGQQSSRVVVTAPRSKGRGSMVAGPFPGTVSSS